MKKSILWMRESILLTLLASVLVTVIGLVGTASPQTIPKTTVYLDPPTINGTVVGEEFTVNLMIRDAYQIRGWQAGLIFNANLLNCTGFFEGEFLKSVGQTNFNEQDINNTAGLIIPHSCSLVGLENNVTGDGQLGYLTFKVTALGVSDLHLRDVKVFKGITEVRIKIIDVYTVVLDTTPHTVFIVSNSTGAGSGFYGHAFNPTLKTLSFNVAGPRPGFSNVTIPKTLLNVSTLDKWKVRIDGILLSTGERTVTENDNTSIYFTYTAGIHEVQITTRISSVISIALSSTSIVLGSNVTISGNITAEDHTGRPNVNVTIQCRPIGAVTWDTVDTVKTDSNSNYTYTRKPEMGGIHEVMASWEGDEETIGDESDVLPLTVIYVFEPVQDFYVFIETNSTVAEFNSIPALNFSQPLKQISFNVTSPYGAIGFSNVTIPKTLLPPPEPPIEWKVVINGTLLSTEERTVTENDNTCIYFTYSRGVNQIQITTRMSSNLSLALNPDSIVLGSSVTISGNITAEDHTMRPNATVTIQSKPSGAVDWTTLDTVETDTNGNYTYAWTPGTAGIHEVMASWEGDNETLGDKSDVQTLAVIENSTILIALSSTSITVESSVIISGAIDPVRPWVWVTIGYRPSGGAWSMLRMVMTYLNGSYSYTWTPEAVGTYEVNATWDGDEITHGATSKVLTLTVLKKTSTISIALSSTNITKGESVTISGNITAEDQTVRPDVNVTIQYTLNGGTWTTLDTVETDTNGSYTYAWTPDEAGTYEVKASWGGDETTYNATSDVLTLKVKGAPGIPLEIVIVAVVAIIIIAAVVVYFVKFRKP